MEKHPNYFLITELIVSFRLTDEYNAHTHTKGKSVVLIMNSLALFDVYGATNV